MRGWAGQALFKEVRDLGGRGAFMKVRGLGGGQARGLLINGGGLVARLASQQK